MATNRPRALQVYDPVLTNIARRYKSRGFIARQLLPSIPVATLSGQYPVFDKGFWFQQLADNQVNDRAPVNEVDFTWSTESYLAKEYGLKISITELERLQALSALRLEKGKTELLTQQMELAHEIRVAALLLPSGLGGGLTSTLTHTAATGWDSTGNPETDIKQGAIAVYRKIGRRPNAMVLPFEVAYALAVNTNFRNQLRYDAAGKARQFIEVGDQVVPSVIHGMTVIIPDGAQVDGAREGGAESISEIWGKRVRLLFIDPSAEWGMPSVAYLMQHTSKKVTRWSETDPDVDYVREMERYDLKVVAPDAGYSIEAVIA
jgi:hypothetical protein